MPCSWKYEDQLLAEGFSTVAGVDEAGRGPLAGPVVAAAVVLTRDFDCSILNDSKKLTHAQRDRLFNLLSQTSGIVIGVGSCSPDEIDQENILRATHRAMHRAVAALPCSPAHLLVDGLAVPGLPVPHQALVSGDALSFSIAAASVIAKVTRDQTMCELDRKYPEYGFARHKGYGTREHLEALQSHGPCPIHRRSFGPVRQMQLPL